MAFSITMVSTTTASRLRSATAPEALASMVLVSSPATSRGDVVGRPVVEGQNPDHSRSKRPSR